MSRWTPGREAELREYVRVLGPESDMGIVMAEIDALREEQATMLADNAAVEDETDKLRLELAELQRDRDEHVECVIDLAAQVEAATEANHGLAAELAEANARVAELVAMGERVLRCVDHRCACDFIVRTAITKAAKEPKPANAEQLAVERGRELAESKAAADGRVARVVADVDEQLKLRAALADLQRDRDDYERRWLASERKAGRDRRVFALLVEAAGKVPIVVRQDKEPYSICLGCSRADGNDCDDGCWASALEHAVHHAEALL
jgi:regulator of replication initiation timing